MSLARFFYTNYPKQYGFYLGIRERCVLPFKQILFNGPRFREEFQHLGFSLRHVFEF